MPRLTGNRLPKYRKHKASGQAFITVEGRDLYLGLYGTQASRLEYDRVVAEWMANGRTLSGSTAQADLTINEIAWRYLKYANGYYVKNGQPTGTIDGIKVALRFVCKSYGQTLARDFGPLALAAIRNGMIEADMCRTYVNACIGHVRRIFKWAVSQELIPAAVHQALATLSGLRRGRSAARETAPIKPVSDDVFQITLQYLRPIVADMARIQRLTGCRPDEVCMLRPCDLDQTGDVWAYRPESHKTEHHDRRRVIFIGPRAQAILRPYLSRAPERYCFCPMDAEASRNEERRARRVSPMTPSQAARTPKKRPKRTAGLRYTEDAYRRAIHRACDDADRQAHENTPGVSADQRIFARWSPNRLRHSAGTEIRQRFGLEAAQVTLGHASCGVTEIYAERDLRKAAEVMRIVG